MSGYDFGYFNDQVVKQGIELIEKAKISLNGYIKYTQKKLEQNLKSKL